MSDIAKAREVPCPVCKMPSGAYCIDLETGEQTGGVHNTRIYRAYVVAEAAAHNRAAELAAENDRLRRIVKLVTELTHDTDGEDLDPDTDIPVGEVMRALAGESA